MNNYTHTHIQHTGHIGTTPEKLHAQLTHTILGTPMVTNHLMCPEWPGFSIGNPMSRETPQSQATQALVTPHIIEMNQDWTPVNTSNKISAALGAKISGCSGPELRGPGMVP